MSEIISVLYAEDNPQDADMTRAQFEREAADFHLEIVATGTACLKRLTQQSFDILLLDNHLPDMEGLDVLVKIRAEGYSLPVVLVTGVGDEDVVAQALRAGAADYVSKSENDYLTKLPDLLRMQRVRHRQHLVGDGGEPRTWNILYLEPNSMDVELTTRHLVAEAPHLKLHTVSSSRDALALLTQGHHFDLILSDMRVPDMNSPEFMREAQHRGIELPFIVITGKGDEASAVAILRLGAYDYIVKRDNYLTHLPHAIDHALHRFHLDQTTRRLNAQLSGLNASLEQKVEARTAELRHEIEVRKQAEAEIKERERQLTTLISNLPGVAYRCRNNADYTVEFISDSIAEMIGYPAEDFLQQRRQYGQLIHPDDQEGVWSEIQIAIQEKRPYEITYRFHHASGAEKWAWERGLGIHDNQGQLLALEGFITDITARKHAELSLRESERRLRAIIETEPECVKIVDSKGNLLEMNAAGLAMLEAESLNIVQQHSLLNYIVPEYQAAFRALHKRVMAGESGALEFEVIGLRGARRWLETHAAPMRNEAGTVVSLLGITRDITERKLADAQLKLSAAVFEQSREAFLITDANNDIVMVNPAFTVISGYSEAEVLGKNPRLLYSGHQDKTFYHAMWTSINTQGHWQGEILDRRKDGSVYPKWLSISRVLDGQGNVTNYIGIFSDISQHKQDEAHIQRLAHFDSLTGLPNRVLLNDRIGLALSTAQRNRAHLALMFVDLDHFKNVNDTLGHRIGDALLIEVAKRLKSAVRDEDTVSRLGGDEFIFVLPNTDAEGAAHVARKLLETVAKRCQIEQHELIITPSIGIAIYPDDGEDFESLSKSADVAMYRAKRDGRNNYRFFTGEMQARSVRILQLENALRHALERDQLLLYYQPQVSLQNGLIIGAEALLRWQHPEFGMVSPAEFIPIAEDSGQILQIGEWVLRTAVRQLKVWMDGGMMPMTMAVNLSVVQFRHLNLPAMVSQILDEAQVSSQYLELELTEGVAMDDPLSAIAIMDNLHQRGVRLSIDDFGTGYSSLNYLKRFQVYKLKIDQSFVRDISVDPEDRAIVGAIIRMADALGMETIAEGVETEGQLAFLRDQGCGEMQGYYFSKPLSADQFEVFVQGWDKSK